MAGGSSAEDAPEKKAPPYTDMALHDSMADFLEGHVQADGSASSASPSLEREFRRWMGRAENIHREHMERLQIFLVEEWSSFLETLHPEVFKPPVPPPPLQLHPESPPHDWLRPLPSPPPTPPGERPSNDSQYMEADRTGELERAMRCSPTPPETPLESRSQSSSPGRTLSNEASPRSRLLEACQPGSALHDDSPKVSDTGNVNVNDGKHLRDDDAGSCNSTDEAHFTSSLPAHPANGDAPDREHSAYSGMMKAIFSGGGSKRAQTPVVVWRRKASLGSDPEDSPQRSSSEKRRMMKSLRTKTTINFDETESVWNDILYSKTFNIFSFIMAVVNMASIGLRSDCKMKALLLALPPATYCRTYLPLVGELLGFLVLIFETVVRLLAEKRDFWKGGERVWNCCNVFLIIETGFYFAGDALPNLSFIRVFRVVSTMGLLDYPIIDKFFRSMQMMVFIIWHCMPHWVWTMATLVVFVYLFAIVLMWQIQLSLRSGSIPRGMVEAFALKDTDVSGGVCESWHDPGLCVELMLEGTLSECYGTFARTFLTLFKAISGGDDWGNLMTPLQEFAFVVPLSFLLYVSLMFFGVLNIVLGLFVDTAMQMSQTKRDLLVKNLADKEHGLRKELQKLFLLADSDGSGAVNSEEFTLLLNTPEVSALLSSMELDIQEAHGLFRMMDIEGTDEVSIDDFITCALRVKGLAKSIDVCMLLYEHRQHAKAYLKNFGKLSEALVAINEKLTYTISQQRETRQSLAASHLGAPPTEMVPPSPFGHQPTTPAFGAPKGDRNINFGHHMPSPIRVKPSPIREIS